VRRTKESKEDDQLFILSFIILVTMTKLEFLIFIHIVDGPERVLVKQLNLN
jgi:hypothetical protein